MFDAAAFGENPIDDAGDFGEKSKIPAFGRDSLC
jgi:hypothetical protein